MFVIDITTDLDTFFQDISIRFNLKIFREILQRHKTHDQKLLFLVVCMCIRMWVPCCSIYLFVVSVVIGDVSRRA